MEERFDLKQYDRTVATLVADGDGRVTLEHNLTAEDLDPVMTVDPVDEAGELLKIVYKERAGVDVALLDASGVERLGIPYDKYGYLDVTDPKKIAGLREELWPSPGSANDQPISTGDLVLRLGPFQRARIYCDRVLDYDRIEFWLKNTVLRTQRNKFTLTEELFRSYNAFTLKTLLPVGADVIGAEGRIDILGTVDQQGLLYLAAGGPQFNVTMGMGPSATRVPHRVFKNVTDDGWYWLENVRLGHARLLDEALFKDLLKGVADLYELSAP
jgi:hypothetical protein